MQREFEEAEVTGYHDLIPAMKCHVKDRHVLAAAIIGGASQIITSNVRDFPEASVEPYGIEVVHPDAFLMNVLDLYPSQTVEELQKQAAALQRPPMSLDDVLRALSPMTPNFVQAIANIVATQSS